MLPLAEAVIAELAGALRLAAYEPTPRLPTLIADWRQRLCQLIEAGVGPDGTVGTALTEAYDRFLDGMSELVGGLSEVFTLIEGGEMTWKPGALSGTRAPTRAPAGRRDRVERAEVGGGRARLAEMERRSHDQDGGRSPEMAGPASPLTPREHVVLELLAGGAGTGAIAEAMAISPHTVKTHVTNLLQKLGVGSRLSVVARARELGLL